VANARAHEEDGRSEDDVTDEEEGDDDADVQPIDVESHLDGSAAAALDATASSVVSPSRASSSRPSTASKRTPRLPRMVGFGPDDGHLIDRPLFGNRRVGGNDEQAYAGGNSARAANGVTAAQLLDMELARSVADDSDVLDAPVVGGGKPSAAGSSMSLSALLEAKRAARLGHAHRAAAKAANKTVGSRKSVPRSDGEGEGHSSMGTSTEGGPSGAGVALLNSFIQAQATNASEAHSIPAVAVATAASVPDEPAALSRIHQFRRDEREHKNAVFLAASSALAERTADGRRNHSTQTSSEDEEEEESEDDDGLPIDPRAAAASARRIARRQ
jgi:hypothetical protein